MSQQVTQYQSNWNQQSYQTNTQQQPITQQQNFKVNTQFTNQQFQNQQINQTPQFQNQQTTQYQNRFNPQQKQYNETVCKLVGFSFPFNHLLMVSLMKRIPNDSQADYKELFFGFVTCVMGVGQANSRTYDFNQKIVQKFSLKDLESLSFALKQLACNNTNVLPFTKFTNSGSGAKTLYLQYKENIENFNSMNNSNHQFQSQTQQTQNTRKMENNIVLGSSFGNIKINIPITKSDAYSIGDIIEKLYDFGLKLEIQAQCDTNSEIKSSSGVQSSPMSNPVTIG